MGKILHKYKISNIVCPYCGFKDVKIFKNGLHWCCDCGAYYKGSDKSIKN
ncbi:MAG: hypothetical protein WC516_07995 [Patescibacteria group bacterium]